MMINYKEGNSKENDKAYFIAKAKNTCAIKSTHTTSFTFIFVSYFFFYFDLVSEAHRIKCTNEFAKPIMDSFATYPELKVVVTKLIPQEKGEDLFEFDGMCFVSGAR